MRLYIYHHCPFCLRAVMVANYKDIDHETVFLLNDDAETGQRLIGAKQVPILEKDDGSAMAESLDIARYLATLGNEQRIIRDGGDSQPFSQAYDDASHSISALFYPRALALGLPEFMCDDACHYFRVKKESALGMSFDQAMRESGQHLQIVQGMINSLPAPQLPSDHSHSISWDDLLIFPTLRNLSMVEGLNFPPHLMHYLNEIDSLCGAGLYFDQAL